MNTKKLLNTIALCGALVFASVATFPDTAWAAVGGQDTASPVASYQEIKTQSDDVGEKLGKEQDNGITPVPGAPPSRIVINTASRGLYFYNHGVKTRLYPVAIGAPGSPTPVGYYKVIEMEVNPSWTDPRTGYTIPSGPDCPLGYRWIRFYGNYGIHGTNNNASIGTYVSNGCVRMFEHDVEELYELIDIGTPVEITYNRVVVEKAYDDTVVYYIYPDGYDSQPLTNSKVREWLKGFGVDSFISDEDIASKIHASDGNPTYIAKVYEIMIDDKTVSDAKAVVKGGITYLPVDKLAAAGFTINNKNGVISTKTGVAPAYIFKDNTFVNADDTENLYGLQGGLSNGVYRMYTLPKPTAKVADNQDRHSWDKTEPTNTVKA